MFCLIDDDIKKNEAKAFKDSKVTIVYLAA